MAITDSKSLEEGRSLMESSMLWQMVNRGHCKSGGWHEWKCTKEVQVSHAPYGPSSQVHSSQMREKWEVSVTLDQAHALELETLDIDQY